MSSTSPQASGDTSRTTEDTEPDSKGSSNATQICNALVSLAYHETDWRWAQETCLAFLENPDDKISGLAAICLGHIARIHRRLDKTRVMNRLLAVAMTRPQIAVRIQDALDDIGMFTK